MFIADQIAVRNNDEKMRHMVTPIGRDSICHSTLDGGPIDMLTLLKSNLKENRSKNIEFDNDINLLDSVAPIAATPLPTAAFPKAGFLGRLGLALLIILGGNFYPTTSQTVTFIGNAVAPSNAEAAEESLLRHGDTYTNQYGMKFVFIGPGTFMMGSPAAEKDREDHETLHKVTLTQGYWIQTTELTQAQWQMVMGGNPSHFSDCTTCPVEDVSFDNIKLFIRKINHGSKVKYRLPTEAEWEYAARANSKTSFSFGNSYTTLKKYGWFDENSEDKPHPVGEKQPNAWGLYDMSGNVFEFVSDYYADYPAKAVIDPTGPTSGVYHIVRGGGWVFPAGNCRSAFRAKLFQNIHYYGLGFRLAAEP